MYDHGTHELTDRQHTFHKQVVSTVHVHLDSHNCVEVLILRGRSGEIRRRAEQIVSVKGIKHGKLTMTSTGKALQSCQLDAFSTALAIVPFLLYDVQLLT